MSDEHPLVRYVRSTCQRNVEDAQQLCATLSEPKMIALANQLTASERDLVSRVRDAYSRLACSSEQLQVAVDQLVEVERLARVCTPEVLAKQLEDLLDAPEFLRAFGAPLLRPEKHAV
jgi:hypothetical protein